MLGLIGNFAILDLEEVRQEVKQQKEKAEKATKIQELHQKLKAERAALADQFSLQETTTFSNLISQSGNKNEKEINALFSKLDKEQLLKFASFFAHRLNIESLKKQLNEAGGVDEESMFEHLNGLKGAFISPPAKEKSPESTALPAQSATPAPTQKEDFCGFRRGFLQSQPLKTTTTSEACPSHLATTHAKLKRP